MHVIQSEPQLAESVQIVITYTYRPKRKKKNNNNFYTKYSNAHRPLVVPETWCSARPALPNLKSQLQMFHSLPLVAHKGVDNIQDIKKSLYIVFLG